MKIIFLLTIVILIASCNQIEQPVADNSTKINGFITLPKASEITIYKDNRYDLDYEGEIIATTNLDSNGKFSVQFPCEKGDIIKIKSGNELLISKLFVVPGDIMKINIDNSSEEGDLKIKYSGLSTKINNYTNDFNIKFTKDNKYYNNLNNQNINEFIEYAEERKKEQFDFFEEYFKGDSILKIFKNNEISNINYQYAFLMNEWAIRNYFYQPDKWNTEVLPQNYFKFLNDIKLDEPYLTYFLDRYLESLIWDWHIQVTKKGIKPTTIDREKAKFEIAKKQFSGLSRDIAMALCINELLTLSFHKTLVELIGTLIEDFKKNVKDKNFIPPLELKYNKRLSLLKGNPAPEFTLTNQYNAPISLSDFIGKVVVLNFWGTWYSPGVKEIPKMIELQKVFENDDVVFISIALENINLKSWKKFVKDNKMPGIQLYSEGQFSSKIAKDYMLNSLPIYFLIDKNGNIYKSDVVMPSYDTLIEEIKSLLIL